MGLRRRVSDDKTAARLRALLLLDRPDLGQLAHEDVQRTLLGVAQVIEVGVPEQHLQRVAETAELPAVAADLIEDRALELGLMGLAKGRY